MKARIALLYGGASSEHDVSVMGYEYMRTLLTGSDFELLPVFVDKTGEWHIRLKGADIPAYPTRKMGGSLYTGYGFIKIDAAIPLLHGEGGEDGSVQGALEVSSVPYVGADVCTSAVCLDKAYTKAIANSLGIPTVPSVSFQAPTDAETALAMCESRLGFPMFIKPRRLGSSVGAYPAKSKDDFKAFFPLSMKEGKNLVTVEKMLTNKRELECAFYGAKGERIITPPGEILVDGFYGYGEKYGGKTVTHTVASVSEAVKREIRAYCERLADTLRLRHLARIDFFLTDEGLYFNEINTFPGFTSESLYPKMLEAHGIAPRDAIISFIEDALAW